jgi:uracil-DNA glycosylase family 4
MAICSWCQEWTEKGWTYVEGEGPKPARYLLVGEAPGEEEDQKGRPFIGKSGMRLRRALREISAPLGEIYLTNSVRCRPGKGNPDPNMKWLRACREVCMEKTLKEVDPTVIVCLGKSALRLFSNNWNMPLVSNRHKPYSYKGYPVVATFHPAYIERNLDAEEWWLNDLDMIINGDSWDREDLEPVWREVDALTPATLRSRRLLVDVETTGLHPWNGDTLRCAAVRPSGSVTSVLTGMDSCYASLRCLVNDPNLEISGHNLMFDIMWGLEPGEIPECKARDSMYLHYLLDERYPVRKLKHLGLLYTPYTAVDLDQGGINHPIEEVIPYNAHDVAINDLVLDGIESELTDVGVEYTKCAELYGRIIPIFAGMKRTGIPVDMDVLREAKEHEQTKCDEALEVLASVWEDNAPWRACDLDDIPLYEDEDSELESCDGWMLEQVGWDVSVLNRPHDLSDFLYSDLRLRVPRIEGAKRKDGRGSTAKHVLQAVLDGQGDPSGFIQALFDYRGVHENLVKYVLDVEKRVDQDGRVRPRFNITGPVTGRMSISAPALHSTPTGHPMRRAFVPLPGHSHLVQIDRQQAELTDLAQATFDRNLMELINENQDQHQWMADEATAFLHKKYPHRSEKANTITRREAKTVNFGILYGIGPGGLSAAAGFDKEDARAFIDLWYRRYPDVKEFIDQTHYLALRRGYVETSYGRRRNFPLGLSSYTEDGGRAERQAFNFIIQATANDLNFLFLKEWCDQGYHKIAFPLLLIHDAVLFSTAKPLETLQLFDEGYKTWYGDAAEKFLGSDLEVAMRGDAKVGRTWGDMISEDEEGDKLFWFSTMQDEGCINEAELQRVA